MLISLTRPSLSSKAEKHTNRAAFDEKLTREHVLLNAGSLPFSLTGEERWCEDDVPHPALAVDLCVETARDVAWHTAGQSIQDDGCWIDGAMAVHIEHSQQCHEDYR